MLIFRRFVEPTTELENDEKRVDGRDMPVCLANKRSENVNYAPLYTEHMFVIIL